MGGKRLTEDYIEIFVKLYNQKRSITEMQSRFGFTRQTIRKALIDRGIIDQKIEKREVKI